MLRRLGNKFKEPIYKDDLKYVLLYGFIAFILVSVICGIIDGIIHCIFDINGTSFTIAIFFIPPMIAKRVRRAFFNYHILYSIYVILLSILAIYIYNVVEMHCTIYYLVREINIFPKGYYWEFFKLNYNPRYILWLYKPFDYDVIFWSFLKVVFYVFSMITAFRITKSH